MTPEEQLNKWIEGEPLCPNDRGECCPDFSCCQPELLVDRRVRQAFAEANDELRMSMLGMFLGEALGTMHPGKKVHILGVDAPAVPS